MASEAILKQKQAVIDEIKDRVQNANTIVLFDYRGITDSEAKELRVKLRESNSDYKVYKNTLINRALDGSNYDIHEYLEGPSAISFSTDELAPVRVLSDFAKKHEALQLKVGIVEGKVATEDKLKEYASIPSREGLLTMLAGGLMATVRDLSICLDLYAKEKEEN